MSRATSAAVQEDPREPGVTLLKPADVMVVSFAPLVVYSLQNCSAALQKTRKQNQVCAVVCSFLLSFGLFFFHFA